jgi:hypothetical protein
MEQERTALLRQRNSSTLSLLQRLLLQDRDRLGHDTVWFGKWLQTFQLLLSTSFTYKSEH